MMETQNVLNEKDFLITEKNHQTFVDILRHRSNIQADATAFVFLGDGETETEQLTYRELDLKARAVASYLQSTVTPGDRALLIYSSGLDFIVAFFACLYSNIIAVPAYPPKLNRPWSRVKAIVDDAEATVLLTTKAVLQQHSQNLLKFSDLANLNWVVTDEIKPDLAHKWQKPVIHKNGLAFLQYTSGSTGNPKGVAVSHGNLLHNQQIIQQGFEHNTNTIFLGWLPLHHDMGLIANVLQPIYLGIKCILFPPLNFLHRPILWLKAISRYGVTTSGAPNFAYDLCLKRTTPEQRETIDLSSWSVAFNGAEPIRQETLERFSKTFAPYGFKPEAFYPCYGLAEATLMVSGGNKSSQSITYQSNSQSFKSQTLVSCGYSWLGQKIIIVNPESLKACQEEEIGEIWVSGESVAQGYWNKPELTKQVFQATLSEGTEEKFLRTGDLGFIQNEELYLTGRLKDLIIIKGRNYYPEDIEFTIQQIHPSFCINGTVVFTIDREEIPQLVIVQEIERSYIRKINPDELIGDIRLAIMENYGLQISKISLVKPGVIPKTSSGKNRRHACKKLYLDSQLVAIE